MQGSVSFEPQENLIPTNNIRKFAAHEVKKLAEISVMQFYIAILFDWIVICASIYLYKQFPNLFIYLISIALIAGRQHALFGITHEGAHVLIHKKRFINDFLGDIFCSFPLFIRTEAYRLHHSQHHKYLNSEKDPDWKRKIVLEDWQFPMDQKGFWKILRKYILGFGFLEILFFIYALNSLGADKHKEKILWRVVYYLFAAILLTLTHHWSEFFFFWVLPYAYVLPFYNRIRSIAEHFGLKREDEFTNSRNVNTNWLERLLLSPHGVGYHLTHHLFPHIPFYHLKELEQLLKQNPEYLQKAHINTHYFGGRGSVLEDVLKS